MKSLPQVLNKCRWTYDEMLRESPIDVTTGCENHWKLLLEKVPITDVVWIGALRDSGSPACAANFKTVGDWLKYGRAPGQFTCPVNFKNTSAARSNENVVNRRFLVVESDVLKKDEVGAVFRWMMKCGLKLMAVVDTAGKSLHGWFEFSSCETALDELKLILPAFGAELTGLGHDAALQQLSQSITAIIDSRRSGAFFNDFHVADLETARTGIQTIVASLPDNYSQSPVSEDTPIPFRTSDLPDHLDRIAIDQGGNVAGFISTLGLRLRSMLADQRLGPIIEQEQSPNFAEWLGDYIGANNASTGEIAIIDLSLVPSDVTHIVVAVLGRIIFEALQRYRRTTGYALPTVLVLEEAHTFVRRNSDENLETATPQHLCRESFERIAREGRKFGLGLVLSSQRPSELSPTILAQCNTFLLHRIVNDRDQELVAKLVPDNLAGLLRELPSLPSRQAILLGCRRWQSSRNAAPHNLAFGRRHPQPFVTA